MRGFILRVGGLALAFAAAVALKIWIDRRLAASPPESAAVDSGGEIEVTAPGPLAARQTP